MRVILVIFSFLFSCSTRNEVDQVNKVINIDLNKSKSGKFSEQFESPSYTLLNFPDKNPLVNPYNIIFRDGLIFIRDNRVNNLFIFDEDGSVINIIESKGMGPGEFFQIDDFQVTDNRIFIQDTYLRKQLEFDKEGNFIQEVENKYNNTNFYVGENYSIYFLSYQTDYNGYNFIRRNSLNDKEELFYEIPKDLENMIRSDNLNGIKEIPSSDLLYFSLPHSTKLVFIDKLSGFLKDIYFFDFGKYNFLDEKRKIERNLLANLIKEGNLVRNIGLFHSYSDKYLLYVSQGLDLKHYIFMDSEFNVTDQKVNIENDLDGMPYIFPWTATEDYLVYRFHSIDFYNEYLELFKNKNVSLEKGNIHEFFQINKDFLREDGWVLVKIKIK